ncbi:MAG TPA: alpha/beta hydrolase [Burkholderiaceae bacterium]
MPAPHTFSVDFAGTSLRGDATHGECGNVLLLHGAGASARNKFSILRHALEARGVGMTCFDCIGHGETGGEMSESSLLSRTRQAEAVIAHRGLECGMDAPLSLIGFSMGAYNAIRLTQTHEVGSLILIVPGVYTPSAYGLPFGPQFSSAIRRERSWEDSDAWEILSRYRGRLLVIAAGNDAVIPREIPERLVASSVNAQWRRLLVVPDTEHRHLFAPLLERPKEFDDAMALIGHCLHLS